MDRAAGLAGGRRPRSRRRRGCRSRASGRSCPAAPGTTRAAFAERGRDGLAALPPGRRRAPASAPSTSPSAASSAKPCPTLWKSAPEAIGIATDVGCRPAELLGDLVRERLRALGVVRAQVDVDEAPRQLERELHREPRAVVVGAVDGVDRRAVDGGRGELLRLEVGRDEDGGIEALRRGARRDRTGEVAGRRARERRRGRAPAPCGRRPRRRGP